MLSWGPCYVATDFAIIERLIGQALIVTLVAWECTMWQFGYMYILHLKNEKIILVEATDIIWLSMTISHLQYRRRNEQ